jgi:hypothetical protein
MNEASSLSIGVDEELPSFSAVVPVPMLTRSLQDRYLFRPPGARLSPLSCKRVQCAESHLAESPRSLSVCRHRVDDEYINQFEDDFADLICPLNCGDTATTARSSSEDIPVIVDLRFASRDVPTRTIFRRFC